MLDKARQDRPSPYVTAELFTGNELVNNSGINSLVGEGMAHWNSHELGRAQDKPSPVGEEIVQNMLPFDNAVRSNHG